MSEQISFADYKERFKSGSLGDKRYFLSSSKSNNEKEVTGIRSFSDGDWVVCGKDNAGFGLSYMVHSGTAIIVK